MKRNIKENNPAGPITYKTKALGSRLTLCHRETDLHPRVDPAGVAVLSLVGNNLLETPIQMF
jgi:hypothetical protein